MQNSKVRCAPELASTAQGPPIICTKHTPQDHACGRPCKMASHLILCTPCVPQERAGIETCGPETQPVTGSFGMLSTKDTPEDAA